MFKLWFCFSLHIALISQYFQLIKIKFKAPNDFWSISKALIFLIALFWWEVEIASIFNWENKGLEIDKNYKWSENNTQLYCLFHDQAMHSELFPPGLAKNFAFGTALIQMLYFSCGDLNAQNYYNACCKQFTFNSMHSGACIHHMLKMVTWRAVYACQSSSSENDMCSLCFSNIKCTCLKFQIPICN